MTWNYYRWNKNANNRYKTRKSEKFKLSMNNKRSLSEVYYTLTLSNGEKVNRESLLSFQKFFCSYCKVFANNTKTIAIEHIYHRL